MGNPSPGVSQTDGEGSALVNGQNTNSTNAIYSPSLPHMSAGTLASHSHEDGDPAGARAPASWYLCHADNQQYLFDRILDIKEEIGDKTSVGSWT